MVFVMPFDGNDEGLLFHVRDEGSFDAAAVAEFIERCTLVYDLRNGEVLKDKRRIKYPLTPSNFEQFYMFPPFTVEKLLQGMSK
jgi:hypothetical protein